MNEIWLVPKDYTKTGKISYVDNIKSPGPNLNNLEENDEYYKEIERLEQILTYLKN